MHLNDHELATCLDTTDDAGPELRRDHLAECAGCRAAVSWARTSEQRIGALLHLLDHPARPVTFAAIEARAAQTAPSLPRTDPIGQPRASGSRLQDPRIWRGDKARQFSRPSLAWGFAGLAVAAAAAIAAVPKSPVRQMLASWAGRHSRGVAIPAVSRGPHDVQSSSVAAGPRGLAIVARSSRVVLIWRVPKTGSVIEIRPAPPESSPVARVSVLASGDGAIYAVSHDTVVVDNRAAPGVNFEVDLPPPSELAGVTLLVGDRVILSRRGNTLHTQAIRARDGSYSIALTAGRGP